MAHLERILRRMIARAYPELRRLRIRVAFGELPADVLFRYDWDGEKYSIVVTDALRRAPVRVLEGGMAHELAHVARDSRLPPRALDGSLDRYERSRWYRVRDERATDTLAIERGYGRQLLAMMQHARSLGIRFHGEHGLSGREIALAARSGNADWPVAWKNLALGSASHGRVCHSGLARFRS